MLTAWNSFKRPRPAPKWRRWAVVAALAVGACVLLALWWRGGAAGAEKRVGMPPPKAVSKLERLAVLVFKSERSVEVWGSYEILGNNWALLREYPILASGGLPGPKLIEADRQIPEGIYGLKRSATGALMADFPNVFDTAMARRDGRLKPAGKVCILGKNAQASSVSLGDAALEDLCGLVELVGEKKVRLIFAPNDLRKRIAVRNAALKLPWLNELHDTIKRELQPFLR